MNTVNNKTSIQQDLVQFISPHLALHRVWDHIYYTYRLKEVITLSNGDIRFGTPSECNVLHVINQTRRHSI